MAGNDNGSRGFLERSWDTVKRDARQKAGSYVLPVGALARRLTRRYAGSLSSRPLLTFDPPRLAGPGWNPMAPVPVTRPASAAVSATRQAAANADEMFIRSSDAFYNALSSRVSPAVKGAMRRVGKAVTGYVSDFVSRVSPGISSAAVYVGDGIARIAPKLDSLGLHMSWGRLGGQSGFPNWMKAIGRGVSKSAGTAWKGVSAAGSGIGSAISGTANFVLNNNPVHFTRGHHITNFLKGVTSKTGLAAGFAGSAIIDGISEAMTLYDVASGNSEPWKFSDGDGYWTEVTRGTMRAVSGLLFGLPDMSDWWHETSMSGADRWIEGPVREEDVERERRMAEAADNQFYNNGIDVRHPEKAVMSAEQLQSMRQALTAQRAIDGRARTFRKLIANDPDAQHAIYRVTDAIRMAGEDFARTVGIAKDNYDHWDTAIQQSNVLGRYGANGRDDYYSSVVSHAQRELDSKIAAASKNNAFVDIIASKRSEAFRATFGRPESEVDAADVKEFNDTWNSDVLTDAQRALFDVRAYSALLNQGYREEPGDTNQED